MFVVAVFFEAKPGYADRLRAALVAEAAEARANDRGCEQYDVSQDPIDPNAFLLYEVFDSETAYKAHQELEPYARFAGEIEPWVASKRVLTYHRLDTTGMV
jgi:autoinducer 2-degrading protein